MEYNPHEIKRRRVDDERNELLADVASLYYEDGLTQQEISDRLGYSRSCISRFLTEAHKEGIVEVRVNHPLGRNRGLESKIQEKFGLREVRVLETRDSDYSLSLRRLGALAARLLSQHLKCGATLGLSWGEALYEVGNAFRPVHCPNARVIQIVGTVGSVDPRADGPGLVRRFASLMDGRAYTLPAPWLIDNKVVRDALLEDRRMRETLELTQHVDIAMVGIGTTTPGLSSLVRAGYINPVQAKNLQANGVMGDICGHHFDLNGRLMEIPLAGYVFGIQAEVLRKVPLVIGVAAGVDKAQAILGGLRSGLLKGLVTDDRAGALIVEELDA
jgi:DNA-binding transcriptional regulator LsrR (DeoR family)